MHQDHYLSLPALLFYLLNSQHDASTLTIYGPSGIGEICDMALRFLGNQTYFRNCPGPNVIQLSANETLSTNDIDISMCVARHPVPALSYRFVHKNSGRSIVYSGDTAPNHELMKLATGCDILIHECALGASTQPGFDNVYLHSTARDAAETAIAAKVRTLYLVHSSEKYREASLRTAIERFNGSVLWPSPDDRILL